MRAPHPRLSKLHLKEVEDPVTLVRETGVFFHRLRKLRYRGGDGLPKATQHSQWQRKAEIRGSLMSTAKCSKLPKSTKAEIPRSQGTRGRQEDWGRRQSGLGWEPGLTSETTE